MGLIKEPKEIDFFVDSTPLTEEEKKMISDAIAYYKATGRIQSHYAQKRVNTINRSTARDKHKRKVSA